MHEERSPTHVKDPVVHVRIRWIMETPNNPACTEKVSFTQIKCHSLHNVEVGRKKNKYKIS